MKKALTIGELLVTMAIIGVIAILLTIVFLGICARTQPDVICFDSYHRIWK